MRRGSDWNAGTPPDWPGIAETTRRGFTFHEMLDNIGLIHMNGRAYDPAVGRFMSVDPIIGNLGDSQSVNPFAYVGNRPLNGIDPTGLEFVCLFVCKSVLASIGSYISSLFGSGPPPPPPATTFPGTSAQNGVNMCDPGMSSGSCNGTYVLSHGPIYGPSPGEILDYGKGVKEYVRYDYIKSLLDLIRIKGAIVHDGEVVSVCIGVACNYEPKDVVLENSEQEAGYRHAPIYVLAAEILGPKLIFGRAKAKPSAMPNTGATKAADKVGSLPKPPVGPGSVPKAGRDPKRVWTPSERQAKREAQGDKCATGCGKDIDASNSRGHHVERHADGGKTNDANHAEVCVDCHDMLHSPP